MDNKIADVKEVKAEGTAAKAEDKAAAKKPGRKTASKSTTAAKKTAEKKTTAAKKIVAGEETKKKAAGTVKAEKTTKKADTAKTEAASAKKSAVKPNVVLQYADKSVTFDTLIQNAKNVWEFDMSRKPSEIKELDLYVKPEEGRVYFVVNNTEKGDFAL